MAAARRLADSTRGTPFDILEAAAEAFSERGYAATSLEDVAEILGCTKGRIYYYFRTKGDLFLGIHRQALAWAYEALDRAPTKDEADPRTRLRAMVHNHVTHMIEHAKFMPAAQFHTDINLAREGRTRRKAIDELYAMRRQFERRYQDVINDGIESGDFVAGDVDLITKSILGAVNWMSVWFHTTPRKGRNSDPEHVASEIAAFAVRGVLAEPA